MSVSIKLEGISLSVPHYVQPERRVRSWAGMLAGAAFDRRPPRVRLGSAVSVTLALLRR